MEAVRQTPSNFHTVDKMEMIQNDQARMKLYLNEHVAA
jgi:hypothetical protein